jgi:hypothetical protein
MKKHRSEFHGYVGNLAVLKNGESVKILGGHHLKLFVKTLDGTIKECYHSDLSYVMEE